MTSLPPIDPAFEPAVIRNGNQAAKQAYREGLAFEQMLLDQLGHELAKTADSTDGDSSDASSGPMGSDPASSMYSQLLPSALSSSVVSSGGTGMALELATALDPAIGRKP
jgi:hypothetical protein